VRPADERLLASVPQSHHQAPQVCRVVPTQAAAQAQRLGQRFEPFRPRVAPVVRQPVRRVLHGESVPALAKLVSLFAPPTQLRQRHQPGQAVACGRKLGREEGAGGLGSRSVLVPGAGMAQAQVAGSLAGHKERFGRAPWLVAGERGVSSADNEAVAQQAGVQRVVLPPKGQLSPQRRGYERQRGLRRGLRLRAGIAGRLSVWRRRLGLDRCLEHGEVGLGRWVGWGMVTANLAKIAQAQVARRAA
jgi:hypothetical protein